MSPLSATPGGCVTFLGRATTRPARESNQANMAVSGIRGISKCGLSGSRKIAQSERKCVWQIYATGVNKDTFGSVEAIEDPFHFGALSFRQTSHDVGRSLDEHRRCLSQRLVGIGRRCQAGSHLDQPT